MKILVDGREMKLNPKDVAVVRDATSAFIASVKDVSVESNRPELYFTLIIYLYMKAAETIDAITPQAMQYILEMISAANDVQEAAGEKENSEI